MTINAIVRGNYVRRFHASPDLARFGNSVGHHHAMVAQIVLHICPAASRDLLRYALHHDSAEQFTGDMPHPFKAINPNLAASLAEVEALFLDQIGIGYFLDDREADILKLADRLADYLHIRHVAPSVLSGDGWPEQREDCLSRAWGLGADMAAKVEAMLK